MRRREFVQSASLIGLAAGLARPLAALGEEAVRNGIGLQLWTVRNQLEKDREATLRAIADAGYQQVELMNVVDSVELAKSAKDLGLRVRSAFFNWETIANPTNSKAPKIEQVIDVAQEMGLEYLVFGYIGKPFRDTADKLRQIADRANAAADRISAAGLKMSYHNHSFEFEKLDGDQSGFDIFIERFDKKLVNFELDVFWAAIGGWEPVETIEGLGNRIGQIHLKDLKAGTGTIFDEGKVPHDAFEEVGDGVLDMQEIFDVASAAGVTQFHVEQDQSPDPIASIAQSIRYVREIW